MTKKSAKIDFCNKLVGF